MTEGDAAALVGPMRAAIARIDPALAVADVTTMSQVMADASAPQRFSTVVLGASPAARFSSPPSASMGRWPSASRSARARSVCASPSAPAGSEVLRLVVRQGMSLTILASDSGLSAPSALRVS